MLESNKKQVILAIAVLFLGILATVGSYAYWSWSSTTNKSIVFNTAKGLEEYIEYDSGDSKFIGDFQVSSNYCKGIHTTIAVNKTSDAASYNLTGTIYMDVNTIGDYMKQSSAVKWVITSGDASNAGSDNCPSITTALNTGNFYGTNNGDTIELYPPFNITTTPQQFTVWIWIDSSEVVNPNITGETLDVEVYTQIDQVVIKVLKLLRKVLIINLSMQQQSIVQII